MPFLRITALMSVPRLCFTDNMFCAIRVFPALGIEIARHSGAFWEQSLSKIMKERVDAGDDYIVTVDYDSVYTREHFLELLRLIETTGADAIFAAQMKRESNNILLTIHPESMEQDGKIDLTKELTRARAGHFGMTIIRCESLKKVPQPWLWSTPDKDTGLWNKEFGNGRFDADVAFWAVADSMGWRTYQANRVKVGHIQRVITWPTADWKVCHQHMDDFEANGIPQMVLLPKTEVCGESQVQEIPIVTEPQEVVMT